MYYYIPILVVVFSNVTYHLASKKVPNDTNPFFFVMVSYIIGFLLAIIAFYFSKGDMTFSEAFTEQRKLIDWTPIILGISVIGLEIGNVMMYRLGWDISKGALVTNIFLALVLVVVGTMFFKDAFGLKQVGGLVFCIVGLYLLV